MLKTIKDLIGKYTKFALGHKIVFEGHSDARKCMFLMSLVGMMDDDIIIMETGFNAGASATAFCEASRLRKTDCKVISIEIDEKKRPIAEEVISDYPNLEVIFGDSTTVLFDLLPKYTGQVDIFFVDGGHLPEQCVIDIKYALLLLKPNGILLVDDSNHEWIEKAIKETIGVENTLHIAYGSGLSLYQCK